jgi:hypothetical protein
VFEALDAFFDAPDFGLEEVAHVVEAFTHVIEALANIVEAFTNTVEPVVDGIAQVVDAAILEVDSKQVPADDDGDWAPLAELIHWIHFSVAREAAIHWVVARQWDSQGLWTLSSGVRHRVN